MLIEKGVEAYIIQNLYMVISIEEHQFDQYNRADCVVESEMLFKFLEEIQPNEIA